MYAPDPRRGTPGLSLIPIAIAVALVVLGAIQVFAWWFGPCLRGTC